MFDLEEMIRTGKECGFTHVAPLRADTIQLNPEVRKMCESNSCGMYGANWCCPPGMGELKQCEEIIRRYSEGILVQTVGELEDMLDGETMMETEAAHKEHFDEMHRILLGKYPHLLACGAGTCTRCKKCTYPDAPCRFPENHYASMEAYGMLVTQVCQANDLPYYYGPCTIAYTSCFLLG
ncbi:MAG: DUF2284 domain-containing protein [Lachnospiraceae bacterium]|nr:DUF2284 domain-containing protein [Lachnospiraceae bacterium]